MKHTKHFIVALALLSVSNSVFAANVTAAPTTSVKMAAVPSAATTSGTTVTPTSAPASPDALSVLGDPVLVSQTATSVTLQWEKVAAAKSYVVKYGKKSVSKAFEMGDVTVTYDSESDQVTSTGTTISNLKPDTTYYFAIVGLDEAKNESSATSKELSVTLSSTIAPATVSGATAPVDTASGVAPVATTASSLKLTGVNVVNEKTLTVDFSAPLSKSPVTLKVRKSSDNSAVTVASVVADPTMPNRVKVNLTNALSVSSSYSIIVIDAADAKGLPISEGVNAQKEFATTATLAKAGVVLNAAPETESGATASSAEVTPVTATSELPGTGTQENLLLLIAGILALGIVYGMKKKQA